MTKKSMKRIHTVTIKRMADNDPDTSWLGEYSNNPASEFAIDRFHDSDCPQFWANGITDDSEDSDCNCNNTRNPREFAFFNPGSVETFEADAGWIPKDVMDKEDYWRKAMQQNARSDYERMESLNRGLWGFVGVGAEARIQITRHGPFQDISSGSLWGIESDSDDYLKEVEEEQLTELRAQLHALGFSQRAISAAFKNVVYREV